MATIANIGPVPSPIRSIPFDSSGMGFGPLGTNQTPWGLKYAVDQSAADAAVQQSAAVQANALQGRNRLIELAEASAARRDAAMQREIAALPPPKADKGGGGIGSIVGTAVGAAAGAFAGNPMAGASIGGSVGGMAGNAIDPASSGDKEYQAALDAIYAKYGVRR